MKRVQFTTIETVRRRYELIVDDGVTAGDIAFANAYELDDLLYKYEDSVCEVISGQEELEPGSFREISA